MGALMRLIFTLLGLTIVPSSMEATDTYDVTTAKVEAALRLITGYVKSHDPLPAAMWYDVDRFVERVEGMTDTVFREAFDPQNEAEILESIKDKAKQLALDHHSALIKVTSPMGRSTLVDPYIQGMMNVMQDPDCMEREFVLDDDPTNKFWDDAVDVFRKCKFLLIKNVFEAEYMTEYRGEITSFLHDLHEGRISAEGSTTHFDDQYIYKTGKGRWDIVLPRNLAKAEIMGDEHVHFVINRERVLSADVKLLTYGLLLAESGAEAEEWRSREEPSLFSDKGLKTHGLAGHDVPTTAAMMVVPLKDSTEQSGLMEFCMGSSWLQGFSVGDNPLEELNWADSSLLDRAEELVGKGSLQKLSEGRFCPESMVRKAAPQFGDLLIFDYKLKYRTAPNQSTDIVANVYVTYGREWFKDVKVHFDKEKDNYYDYFLKVARFALPDPSTVCQSNADNTGCIDEEVDPTLRLEDVRDFLHHKRQHIPDESLIGKRFEFPITNIDIDRDDVHVWVQESDLGTIGLGETQFINAAAGEKITLKTGDGEELMGWRIRPYQTQIAASKVYIQTNPPGASPQ